MHLLVDEPLTVARKPRRPRKKVVSLGHSRRWRLHPLNFPPRSSVLTHIRADPGHRSNERISASCMSAQRWFEHRRIFDGTTTVRFWSCWLRHASHQHICHICHRLVSLDAKNTFVRHALGPRGRGDERLRPRNPTPLETGSGSSSSTPPSPSARLRQTTTSGQRCSSHGNALTTP